MMYSVISILLTCFGLFGMALYAIEQRTKEIGIRKVERLDYVADYKAARPPVYYSDRVLAFVTAVPVTWWLLDPMDAKLCLWASSQRLGHILCLY